MSDRNETVFMDVEAGCARESVAYARGGVPPVPSAQITSSACFGARVGDRGIGVNKNQSMYSSTYSPETQGRFGVQWEQELARREADLLARERDLLHRERYSGNVNTRASGAFYPGERNQWTSGMGTMHARTLLPRDVPDHVLPEFNPDEPTTLTATEWIRRVEEIGAAYDWDDRVLLARAAGKLHGAARLWHSSITESVATWPTFRAALVRGFPQIVDETRIHGQLASRRKQRGESYETYAYTMKAIARRGRICDETTVKYILRGLDGQIANALAIGTYATVEDLLSAISLYEARMPPVRYQEVRNSYVNGEPRGRSSASGDGSRRTATRRFGDTTGVSSGRPDVRERSDGGHGSRTGERTGILCFRCGARGHVRKDCPQGRRATDRAENTDRTVAVAARGLVEPTVRKYLKDVVISGNKLTAQIDTGACVCLIKREAATRINLPVTMKKQELRGFGEENVVESYAVANVTVIIDGVRADNVEFAVVPDKAQIVDVLIGRTYTDQAHLVYVRVGDTLRFGYATDEPYKSLGKHVAATVPYQGLLDDLEKQCGNAVMATAKVQVEAGQMRFIPASFLQEEVQIPVANYTDQQINLEKGQVLMTYTNDDMVKENPREDAGQKFDLPPEDQVKVGCAVTEEQRTQLMQLIRRWSGVFATNLNDLGCTQLIQMDIKEKPGSSPVSCRPYKASFGERDEMKKIIEDWKAHGIVTESTSPYGSPALLVKKKTGESRLVVDFRRLNQQTVPEPFPLPTVDDQLAQLSGKALFAILDLAHGFLQVPLTEEARKKTAFVTPDWKGEFTRMIFGLMNAPFIFARLMEVVLGPLRNKIVLCYIDDLIIAAKSWEELIERLELVFEALKRANLTLRPSKCRFGEEEVEFLGFVICNNSMRPGPGKVRAIREYPEPRNAHEVRRFLGLVGFFRRFVRNYAQKALPLTNLTKKNAVFTWADPARQAFEGLRKELATGPTLRLFSPDAYTELHTDASAEGLAGILLQRGEDGLMHLVQCLSKRTSGAEKMYHSSRLELMAVAWCLERLRYLLLGLKIVVFTDCQCLIYLNANKTRNPQIARWSLMLQDFDIELRHRPGERMQHVDALSRAPTEEPSDTWEDLVERKLEVLTTMNQEDYVLMIQHSDPTLKRIIEVLKAPEDERAPEDRHLSRDYVLRDNILYRSADGPEEEDLRYVVPKHMRKSLVVKFHDQSGHFGVDRTLSLLRENYWFGRMRNYVKNHIGRCPECILLKLPTGKQPGKLHPIPPGQRPFETVHLDHLGPFITSERGNRYILVAVDDLTKYVRLWPVQTTSANDLLECLNTFVSEYGLPRRVVCDRGTCFTSRQFDEFCEKRGISVVLNSTRHPRANGQVERVNRTLVSVLQVRLGTKDDSQWDEEMPMVQRDLNMAENKTTGRSPFYLLYGYRPRCEDGLLRELTRGNDEYRNPSALQEEAREKILRAHDAWKKHHDPHRRHPPSYGVGEVVFMRRVPTATGESTKLQPKYRGPLVITQVLPADTYRVCQLAPNRAGRVFATTAHVSALKAFRAQPDEDDSDDEETEPSDEEEEANEADGSSEPAELQADESPAEGGSLDHLSAPDEGRRPKRDVRIPLRLRDYQM